MLAMSDTCSHLDQIKPVPPSGNGCVECLATGGHWLHLRRCTTCGHVGCCDSSPGRHTTAHFHGSGHPLVQSFEPGEDWYWCYVDELAFERAGEGPSPSHT
jgi:Zn-finger in ubiquitin-hydrolases and other protein